MLTYNTITNKSLMYQATLSAVPNAENNRPNVLQRNQDDERFSSYESPPHANDDFSDFETSMEKEKCKVRDSPSPNKHNTQVLPQQLPLQPQITSSSTNKNTPKGAPSSPFSSNKGQQPSNSNNTLSAARRDNAKLKENCPLKYNYMEKVERHLTTIQEDAKEDLKESFASSFNHLRPLSLHRPPSFGGVGLDSMRWNNDLKLYSDPNMVLLEKQRLEMLMLQQENIALRERVLLLEKQVSVNNEQRYRKEAEMLAERMSSAVKEEQMNTTRKETKLKLVEEVAVLHSRCRQMKEEMRQYKEKQEEIFAKLTREREEAKLEVIRLKAAHSYQAKFTKVFLNMVEKLPVDLEEGWSDKRKIAVGWKVVKHLVKKAFKLGIHPPAITQKY